MKYKYKLALIMGVIGTLSTIFILFTYAYFNSKSNEYEIYQEIKINNGMVSQQIEEDIENLILVTKLISLCPLIKKNILLSNSEFAVLNENDRETKIEDLNTTWMNTTDSTNSFIQERMTNAVAQYLEEQQNLEPGLIGEIFLTNQYGVMLSTTKKLTTLAHGYKYWWKGSFADGTGAIYLDDRGFDESVGDYVLGIVVPIYDGDTVIGIIKVNYKIAKLLTEELDSIAQVHIDGEYSIVRQNGLVISKKDVKPQSEYIDDFIIKDLSVGQNTEQTVVATHTKLMYGIAPITITNSKEKVYFGGNESSIDQQGGSSEGGWYVVYTIPVKESQSAVRETLTTLMMICSILILFIVIISLILGNYIAKPIKILQKQIQKVGEGDLSVRIETVTNDEIGDLSQAFNDMIANLDTITIKSRNLETKLVEQNKREDTLVALSQRDALTHIYNRRAFNVFYKTYAENARKTLNNLAVIMFDIDDFKKINDTYGHLVGDEVLILIAVQISNVLRDPDIFARWGGEEFILLLPNTNSKVAFKVAERIRKTIEQTQFPTNERVTISLGVTLACKDCTEEVVVAKVDEAMYKAKGMGKNQTVLNAVEQ